MCYLCPSFVTQRCRRVDITNTHRLALCCSSRLQQHLLLRADGTGYIQSLVQSLGIRWMMQNTPNSNSKYHTYELVQAQNPKFRGWATNAACNSNSNVTYLESYWPPSTVEVGDTAKKNCQGPRTGASAEMCPVQSQAFKELNISQAFTVEKKKD